MQLRTVKSFVKRTGRMSKTQKYAMDVLAPRHCCTVETRLVDHPIFEQKSTRVLEIGFGMGHSFIDMAAEHPDWLYIGIEVHTPGVAEVLTAIEERPLNNVCVFHHDAVEVLTQCVPEESLDKVQVFFPDPWPKKRHHKRRLLQAEFVNKLHSKLKQGGLLHVATDWLPYAEAVIDMMTTQSSLYDRIDYDPEQALHCRLNTKYEARGERLGHEISDLVYQKK